MTLTNPHTEIELPPTSEPSPAGRRPAPQSALSIEPEDVPPTRQQQRHILRDAAAAIALHRVHGIPDIEPGVAGEVMGQILAEARKTQDPIEAMLVEQLVLIHYRLARLHREAADARTIEQIKVYNAVATRLTAEFRRLALAVRAYRQPPAARSFTVVKLRNERTGAAGEQQTYADESPAQEHEASFSSRRARLTNIDGDESNEHSPQPPARGRRSNQRPFATPVGT